jgi:plasmid stabilization system protein ParE
VKRTVELRPAARRDLDKFDRFLLKMSALAAQRRMRWLRAELASLGDNPLRGQSTNRRQFQLVLRYARAVYVVRYRVTPDAVVITRIWHGRERRPPR